MLVTVRATNNPLLRIHPSHGDLILYRAVTLAHSGLPSCWFAGASGAST